MLTASAGVPISIAPEAIRKWGQVASIKNIAEVLRPDMSGVPDGSSGKAFPIEQSSSRYPSLKLDLSE
jgi:hypothetical protein